MSSDSLGPRLLCLEESLFLFQLFIDSTTSSSILLLIVRVFLVYRAKRVASLVCCTDLVTRTSVFADDQIDDFLEPHEEP